MFTQKKLIKKGLNKPNELSYSNHLDSYCKLWNVGNFTLRITPKGRLQVFAPYNGELIKVIKNENVLDAFIIFATS